VKKVSPRAASTLTVGGVVVVILIVVALFLSARISETSQYWVGHSYEVRFAIDQFRVAALDAEQARRAFSLTHEPDYLEVAEAAQQRQLELIEKLGPLTTDNPAQQARVAGLRALVEDKRSFENVLKQMDDEEVHLLTFRNARIGRSNLLVVAVVAGASVLLVVLGSTIVRIGRDVRRRVELEESLNQALSAATEARQLAQNATFVEARRAKQASMIVDVAAALVSPGPMTDILQHACEAVVHHADAAFARIWTLGLDGLVLELRASAGLYTRLDGSHSRVLVGQFKIGLVAAERKPHVTNDVSTDARIGDPEWARREGLVSFAGYPLLVEDRIVGVMAMFARRPLEPDTLDALEAVAKTASLGIERLRAETAMRASEEYYRFLANSIPDQVWTATPSGALEYVNDRVTTYFERTFDEMIGAGWQGVVHPDDLPGVVASWTHSVTSGAPYEVEFRLRRASDGQYLSHVARALPLRDGEGRTVKWFGTNTNISERKRLERERERLIGALETSNRELDQFAYVASHDLKAPLRGIANLSRWIEEDLEAHLTPESREHLALLRGRAHRMEGLIDGILKYSRAGRVGETAEDVDVGALVQETVELLAPAAEVKVDIAPGMPTISSERVPLQQMFLNLIGNALKHARRDGALVTIAFADAGVFVDFSVRDNGPGIAAEFHQRIWGLFQTLEARDKVEGTGIGLSVVKKLAEVRGGKVWVESAPERGAVFHFLWPKRNNAGTSAEA
jgi:PAS domain S-box-containing protein